jgi:hypothetical protein
MVMCNIGLWNVVFESWEQIGNDRLCIRPTSLPGVKCMLDFEAYSESRQSVNVRVWWQ